jgi:hypothetical protein
MIRKCDVDFLQYSEHINELWYHNDLYDLDMIKFGAAHVKQQIDVMIHLQSE